MKTHTLIFAAQILSYSFFTGFSDAQTPDEFPRGLFGSQYHESFYTLFSEKDLVAIPRFDLKSETKVDLENAQNAGGELLPYPADGVFDSPFVGLRLQKDLTTFGRDREPASFSWQNARNADSMTSISEGAVLLDIYLHAFTDTRFLEYDATASAFRLPAGGSWERNTATSSPKEVRKFLIGADFDYFARTFHNWGAKSRQPGSFNVVYEQDIISDSERFHVDLDWKPVTGLFSLIDDESTFWIGRRSYYKRFLDFVDDDTDRLLDDDKGAVSIGAFTEQKVTKKSYFIFNLDLAVELGGGGSIGDAINSFDESFFRYGLETCFGFFEDRLKLPHSLTGYVPFPSSEESHVHHEFAAVYTASNVPAALELSYKNSERSLDFSDEDLVKLGITFKL